MPYIETQNKNIWALYIPPYRDEIFSSWYFRLAQSHMVKSHSFGKYYFKGLNFWNRDIDNNPSADLRKILHDNSPLDYQTIDNLFLSSYQYYLFENHNPNGYTSGILPLGIVHRQRKNNGLLFCPICLKNKAYYKKEWRLTISFICVECGMLLEDCCSKCKSPIAFHRLEQGNKKIIMNSQLNLCATCGHDLTLFPFKATDIQISTQSKIYSILKSGYSENMHYSFSYFYLLQNITMLLSRRSNVWGRLRKSCEYEFGKLPERDNKYIFWPIKERLSLFSIAFKILDDPNFLKYLIQQYGLRLSEFSKDYRLPYRFEKIFKEV